MGKINVEKMNKVEMDRTEKSEKIAKLTSIKFDLSNEEHTAALKKYVDNFELSANQMHLFQSLSSGLTAWGGSWIVGFILPLPEFARYFLTAAFYFGTIGYVLERFNTTDFFEELGEMKTIYNWCLRSTDIKESEINDILSLPDMNRMIRLMAPFCTNKFMTAWKEVPDVENKGIVSSIINTGWSVASYGASFFTPAPKVKIDHNQIEELKTKVETGGFDVGIFNGFEQSIKFFATNPEFRELMRAKINNPVETLTNLLPTHLKGVFS